jgi:hypothetical protein
MNLNLKPFFTSKKMVVSTTNIPGQLVKFFKANGKKYVRVAFTNHCVNKSIPVTDIPIEKVTGVRVLPTPFKKFIYGLAGKTPKATFYSFKKKS